MKDAALSSPAQRAVALTQIAKALFKPYMVDAVLDTPRARFNGASAIQHARKGVPEFREAEGLLKAGMTCT
jgi:hypothetical protein